jgi:hypothetical protein
MLAVRMCLPIADPFPWFGADPYAAVWHLTLLCAVALAVAALQIWWLAHSWRLAGVVSLMFLGAVILTMVSARFATHGILCAGAPMASPQVAQQVNQQADDSYNTWHLLVTLARFLVVTTISAFAVSTLFVITQRPGHTLRESSGPAGTQ